MPNHYTVIRYVPDPLRGEFLNIGVVAYGDDGDIAAHFLPDDSPVWEFVRQFGNEPIGYLREFVDGFNTRLDGDSMTVDELQEMLAWMNSIQFRKPLPSLRSVEDTARMMAGKFLRGES